MTVDELMDALLQAPKDKAVKAFIRNELYEVIYVDLEYFKDADSDAFVLRQVER